MGAWVRACARARARVCVCVCVRASVCAFGRYVSVKVCVHAHSSLRLIECLLCTLYTHVRASVHAPVERVYVLV